MTRWQRRARLFIAVFAVLFAVAVFFAFRRRPAPATPVLAPLDPTAVVESTAGRVVRMKGTREDVAIDFEKEVTYKDGSSRLMNVKVTATDRRDGRRFTLTGKEGQVTENPSAYTVRGDVRLAASDGLTASAESAAYSDSSGVVQAPGPTKFAKGRFSGTGVGMLYDKNRDAITILDNAVVHIGPDEKGTGAADVTAATATFARRDKLIRFDKDVRIVRGGQTTNADEVVAHLTDDEQHIESVELHGAARIAESAPAAGGLEGMSGRDMTLKYTPDGQLLQHATVAGDAAIQVAGDAPGHGRQIAARTIDISLGPDGATPTALAARDAVQLVFPPEQGAGARTIRASAMEARGENGAGLTSAHFSGGVEFREKGPSAERVARSRTLDTAMKQGMSAIEQAAFAGAVRFEEGSLTARAAAASYALEAGVIQLSGSEPSAGAAVPHVVNSQIAVDAPHIDLTLEGPKMKATGGVKSLLQPAKKGDATAPGTKMPAMLKQDQPVNVVASDLDYDGSVSKARYTGEAQLWQADTSIRASRIDIDDKSGDLAAAGEDGVVTTSVLLEQTNSKTKAKEHVRSLGASKDFAYDDEARRATYTGNAHLSGPEGDITAPKIELYLKPSGDELERAEAYEDVTLRESGRKTTGTRMTYFADTEKYEVLGTPVKVVDECGGETVGRTLTFDKTADTIVLDGKKQFRTQSKGSTGCR